MKSVSAFVVTVLIMMTMVGAAAPTAAADTDTETGRADSRATYSTEPGDDSGWGRTP